VDPNCETKFGETLPSGHDPHNSGPIQWARGGCGAKAPPLAARPWEVNSSGHKQP